MKKILNLFTITVGVSLSMWACGTSSVSAFLFDSDKERQLGEDFNQALKDSIGDKFVAKNHEFVRYVDSLKNEIVATIPAEQWESVQPSGMGTPEEFFSVQVIDEDIANAFAVPGGFFYLYTGILETMEDESELIAVMGHEIGHVLGHHSRDRILKAQVGSAALGVLLGNDGDAAELVASLGMSYYIKEIGKDDELESDSYGVEFSKNIKIRPTGIETYFGRGIVDADGKCKNGSWIEGVFSTHPPHCDRVEQARRIVAGYTEDERAYPKNKGKFQTMVATIKGK